jgi:hypothetical protein
MGRACRARGEQKCRQDWMKFVRLETGADGRSLFEWKLEECSGIV